MPYISKKDRKRLVSYVPATPLDHAGELNYVVTRAVLRFLGKEPNYAAYNAAIGVLECAKLELYRRMVAPYEDRKLVENGDVYPPLLSTPVERGPAAKERLSAALDAMGVARGWRP